MKPLIVSMLSTLLITSCGSSNEEIHAIASLTTVTALVDATERMVQPLPGPILTLYHCDQTPNAACLFRLKLVTDKRLNPVLTYHLKDAAALAKENVSDDPQFRNKCILSFYAAITHAFDSVSQTLDTAQPLPFSEIYAAICDELEYLIKDKSSSQHYLLIFSDLQENSSIFNAYADTHMQTQDIISRLQQYRSLPQNLRGITIFFVYRPATRNADKAYGILSGVYKQMLEGKGAKVVIQAENTHYKA